MSSALARWPPTRPTPTRLTAPFCRKPAPAAFWKKRLNRAPSSLFPRRPATRAPLSRSIAAPEARAEQAARQGMRALAVARAEDDQPLQLVGLAFLYDAPRPDAQHLI